MLVVRAAIKCEGEVLEAISSSVNGVCYSRRLECEGEVLEAI